MLRRQAGGHAGPRPGAVNLWVESRPDLNPRIDPDADVRSPFLDDDDHMSITDYLIDSALVLLVLLQIKERPLTTKALIRPMIIVGVAVLNYLHGIPTAGNDLVLIGVLATLGLLIGTASGRPVGRNNRRRTR